MEKNYVPKQLFKLVSNSAPEEVEETFKYIKDKYGKEAEALARLFNSEDSESNVPLIAQLLTGVSRTVDELGRIVIPREFRKTLEIENGTLVSFAIINDCLVVKKVIPSCLICGSTINLENVKGKQLCTECKAEIIKAHV